MINFGILVVYAAMAVVESASQRRRLAEKQQLNNSHEGAARPGSQQQPRDGAGQGYYKHRT